MDAFRTPEVLYLAAGFVMGFLFALLVVVVVRAIVRDSAGRRVRRGERERRRLQRAVARAAKYGVAPRPAVESMRPFGGRVGDVGRVDTSGFTRLPGPRDWTPGGQ